MDGISDNIAMLSPSTVITLFHYVGEILDSYLGHIQRTGLNVMFANSQMVQYLLESIPSMYR